MSRTSTQRWILQFCHSHYGPFADVARQYAALFTGSPWKVLTVYLTGAPDETVRKISASDEVIFLNFSSKEVGGLKLGAIRALRKIANERDFALAITHRAKPTFIACLATQLPILSVHHAFGDYRRAPRRWFANVFRKRLTLLAVSDAVRDDIRRHLPAWTATKIETLHNRIDVDAVTAGLMPATAARDALGLPQDVPIIGNVGRLHADKDQATLIKGFATALPKLPAGSLLAIVGKGSLEKELKTLAASLGIANRVRFFGFIPNIRHIFTAFDLFVLSSDHEPFGMVLLEAMAAKVPIIATNCGGAPEVVRNESMLFPLRDANALAKCILRVLSDDKPRSQTDVDFDILQSCFSDAAAQKRFFALPAVIAALNRKAK